MLLLVIGFYSFISINHSYAEPSLSPIIKILEKPEDIMPQIQHTCGSDTESNGTDPCLRIKPLLESKASIFDLIYTKRAESSEITDKVNNELHELYSQRAELDRKLEAFTVQCSNNRFKACYPKLEESVPLNDLNELFKQFTEDYRLRYNTGGGACHTRADALAFILAEKGFEAQILRIHNAPTLIAIDRDIDGKPTNRYYDYGGNHTLIQIMVKNLKGEVEPYLIDPQFMAKPLKRKDYFLKTIGQNCNKVESNTSNTDLLSCSYSLMPQNSSEKNPYDLLGDSDFSVCGWAKDQDGEGLAKLSQKKIEETSKNMILMNSNHTKSLIEIDKDDPELTKKLIIASYVNYKDYLNKSLDKLDNIIFQNENEKNAQKQKIEDALSQLPEKIKEIESNLK